MSINAERTAVILVVLLALATFGLWSGTALTGSGGLGAVSAGVPEDVIIVLLLSPAVGLFFYWRHRRRTRRPKTASSP